MKQTLLKEIKERLEKEKISAEEQLKTFATEDPKLKGDWDTKYPRFNGGSGSSRMEEAADEVEEYETLLPIEFGLETKLKDINSALEKIKENKYGKCERCDKEIPEERLKISPEARLCLECQKKSSQ